MQGNALAGLGLGVALATLTACGGGGGGSAGAGIPFTPSGTQAEIDSGNAEVIAASVAEALNSSGEVAELPSNGIFAFSAEAPGSSPLGFVLDTYRQAGAGTISQLNVQPLQQVGPVTDDCPLGGTVRITADLVNPDVLAYESRLLAGDSFIADFSNCRIDTDFTANGGFNFVIREFSGSLQSSSFDMQFDLELDTFGVTLSGDQVVYDGVAVVNSELSRWPAREEFSSDSLRILQDGITWELTNFELVQTLDVSLVVAGSGYIETDVFAGRVAFVIPEGRYLAGDANGRPESGEIIITGDNGTITMVALTGGSNVNLELQLDGVAPASIATTWDDLVAVLENAAP